MRIPKQRLLILIDCAQGIAEWPKIVGCIPQESFLQLTANVPGPSTSVFISLNLGVSKPSKQHTKSASEPAEAFGGCSSAPE